MRAVALGLALPLRKVFEIHSLRRLQSTSLTTCQVAVQSTFCQPPPSPQPPRPPTAPSQPLLPPSPPTGQCGGGTFLNPDSNMCEISCDPGRRLSDASLETQGSLRAQGSSLARDLVAKLMEEEDGDLRQLTDEDSVILAAYLLENPEVYAQMSRELLKRLSAQLFGRPALEQGERVLAVSPRLPIELSP